jgi:hypothetical protein
VAFCEKSYLPKATLPVRMTLWNDLIGLGNRQDIEYLLWRVEENKLLFELDTFDSIAAETVIKMIETSANEAGGLHLLAIMANSGNRTTYLCLLYLC